MKPIRYIDRTWLRRSVLVGVMIPALILYLVTGVIRWGQDFYDTWRLEP